MRQLIYIFILAALVCLGIGGCTPRRVGEAMNRADSLMMSAPDSALALLDAIDPATLRTDAARARHAVLLTRARHLAYVPVYDDSLIAIGTDYYATHGTHAEKAEAFYMSSVVNNYHQRYEQSIVDGLRAEKHALATSDHLLLGLVYRTIADGFDRLYDWSSALHYYTLSYDNFKLAPENIYTDWAGIDLARAYFTLDDYEGGLKLAKNTYDKTLITGDVVLRSNTLRLIAKYHFDKQDYKAASNSIKEMQSLGNVPIFADDYLVLGIASVFLDDSALANICRDSVRNITPTDYSIDYEINKKNRNFEKANLQLEYIVKSSNHDLANILKRNYAATISSFYDKEAESNLRIVKKERRIRYLAISVGVLILLCGIIIYVYRTRILRQDIDNKIVLASNLRSILAEREMSIQHLNTEVESLTENTDRMRIELTD